MHVQTMDWPVGCLPSPFCSICLFVCLFLAFICLEYWGACHGVHVGVKDNLKDLGSRDLTQFVLGS